MTIGVLRQRADFDALLARRPLLRSAHFAVHHVPNTELRAAGTANADLSTALTHKLAASVDKSSDESHRLGCMIPKRHVRRAVTRNLIRRQIRIGMSTHVAALPPGRWLVRVAQPWPASAWPSAASRALGLAVHAELAALFGKLTTGAASR